MVVLLSGEPSAARRCLDAALRQDAEVVAVVLDDELGGLALRRAGRHAHLHVVRLPGVAPEHARHEGAARAVSPHLVVVVPGADLLPGAVAALLQVRRTTAAPVVVGALAGEPASPAPSVPTDLTARPDVARTPLLARLLVDRDLLLSLPAGPDDDDGQVAATGLLLDRFAVAGVPTVDDVRPGSRRALFRSSPWSGLDRRIEADRATLDLLLPREAASRQRVVGILEREPRRLVDSVETATAQEWAQVVDHVRRTTREVDLAALDVEARLAVWLVRADRRADLEAFVRARRLDDGPLPTVVRRGRVLAVVPGLPADAVPDDVVEVHPRESSLRARLVGVRRAGPDLELVLQAGIRMVEQTEADARVTLLRASRRVPARVEVTWSPAVTRWMGERHHGHDLGRVVARVPLADLPRGRVRIEVRLRVGEVDRTGVVTELDHRGSADRTLGGPGGVRVHAHLDHGVVELSVDRGTVEPAGSGITEVRVDDDGVLVRADGVESGPAWLVAGHRRLPGVPVDADGWHFALEADPWGLGVRPAPADVYRLEVEGDPDLGVRDPLLDTLPRETVTSHHRVGLLTDPGGALVVRLDPPLRDDEVGPRAQQRLREAYAEVHEPVDPRLVYFQAFTGRSATDHPAAIQRELARRCPDLRMRWMVADSASTSPAGAEPVQARSREWYDVLARAAYVVTNIDLDRWFRRRPGQEVLQTYHGYPSKRMGLEQWRARGLPDSWVDQELARSSGTWTALLTPQPDADRWYREQYAYDGRILSVGYPRDDVLVGPDREERREEARRRLGLRAGQRALLYAPTWRDDLATDFRVAHAEHHLDLDLLTELLGEGWRVLHRGHRFHGRDGATRSGEVLDLTDYPEVNDLILASDAAVLDYSSLRFDFALTGRPAVYLVPDLDRYTERVRGFLQDYRETAPGPLVVSTEEVAAELAAYDALVDRWTPAIDAFNDRFQRLQDGHAAERVVEEFFAPLLR